ncbi:GNAT family N-acetyltransferase [Nocardioides iriomotensis]|uniref:GNAT family N-acetyltransferase n=1 Tax=Nocardioides iriomotensis TaxID=715784 RepID=A0A4Q5IWE9_9ACTN|nr:GNAT family N-acetyltransferase [Nocardioides iriomotensis]
MSRTGWTSYPLGRKTGTVTTSLVRTRYGTLDDVRATVALHERCSADALTRRFHAPVTRVPERLATQLLAPARGWSVVAEQNGVVVALASVGPVSPHEVEIGVVVEDAQQGRGIGTRLLREVAADAGRRGYRSLLCLTQPDNDTVLRTIERAGLAFDEHVTDGVLTVVMPLSAHARREHPGLPRPA